MKRVTKRVLMVLAVVVAFVIGQAYTNVKAERAKQRVKVAENTECGKKTVGQFRTGDFLVTTKIYKGSHEMIYMVFEQPHTDWHPDLFVVQSSPTDRGDVRFFHEACGDSEYINSRIVSRDSPEFEEVGMRWLRRTSRTRE